MLCLTLFSVGFTIALRRNGISRAAESAANDDLRIETEWPVQEEEEQEEELTVEFLARKHACILLRSTHPRRVEACEGTPNKCQTVWYISLSSE